ncbi:LPS assembly protein LptD [Legionella taurinensis]|nr:LPS assembly protein LptD [Legionella taurinensis]MDX1836383.1 LPS assembly protein LptD [Legionella taurinensis]
MNIRYYRLMRRGLKPVAAAGFVLITLGILLYQDVSSAAETWLEPVQACIIPREAVLNPMLRARIAQCLGWEDSSVLPMCRGAYRPVDVEPLAEDDEIRIQADEVSFYNQGRSTLKGNVEVHQTGRMVNAETAYVYRDAKTNQVNRIELLGRVNYLEPGRLMIARKVNINPSDRSGQAEDVLYRFNSPRPSASLPAWGRASFIERFANKDYFLKKATYTTCAPQDKAWQIEADSIALDDATATGVARHARLRVRDVPVFYTPYLSFPTSKDRKSGFLLPTLGSSNIGGFNFALPYYWNMAPNYDATITPEIYTRRGVMLGGQFRYLTENSTGIFNGRFLPQDRAFKQFLRDNELEFPALRNESSNRWSIQYNDITRLAPNLHLRVNYQQVSDDYFLQDFSSNLSVLTERQLLRQGDLIYTTDHWLFRSTLQSYQTLQPVNQTPVSDIYERLPQLVALGSYNDLPFNGNLILHNQFDQFHWPDNSFTEQPEGPRYHFNPVLSLPQMKPWGYFTPTVELVQNYYNIRGNGVMPDSEFSPTIPRLSADGGLYFDRPLRIMNRSFTQTLEPRLYYLYTPFVDQSEIPVFDSAYMIFNTDQVYRANRFSGYDRISDANQLAYGVTSRWISDESGVEKAQVTVGQIRYFEDRRVQLCRNHPGNPDCIDPPTLLGYLSPLADFSPVATRAMYRFNPVWTVTSDYVWDPYTRSTDNSNVYFHYQPEANRIINLGYTYLVNGDITQVARSTVKPQKNPLHQATISYAWPFNDRWSTLGAFSYNISKRYEMLSFLGVQYDNCCWAVRLVGGRSFQSLNNTLEPQYNNHVYLQFLLKGLGSLGYSDPIGMIRTYLPSYVDTFHQ